MLYYYIQQSEILKAETDLWCFQPGCCWLLGSIGHINGPIKSRGQMRPGSHADSLWGPLWNSNWSLANPLLLPPEKKKHTPRQFNTVFAERNIHKYFHRTVREIWGFMHLIIRGVRTPEYVPDIHLLSMHQQPNTSKGWGSELHILCWKEFIIWNCN